MSWRSLVLTAAAAVIFGGSLYGEVRITMHEAMKFVTSKIQPEYSAMARQMHVTGKAEVEAVITEQGEVDSVKPVSGNPLFTSACVAAVKKWKFNPITVEGQAVKALVTFSFDFK